MDSGDKGSKRQASPLESQIMKRRSDKVYASQGTSSAWISVEKLPLHDKVPSRVNTRSKHKTDDRSHSGHHGGPSSESRRIMESLKNLVALYSGLKQEMHTIHTDLDRKLDGFMREQTVRLESIEKRQQGQELELNLVNEKLGTHDDRINKIDRDLADMNIHDLKTSVQELRNKIDELEEKQSSEHKGFTEEQAQFMYEVARRLEYHESRLKRHDSTFLEVFTDLRDKAISINGLPEEQNENLLDKVLDNINALIRVAVQNPVPISHVDLDMVYRTGKLIRGNSYPRPVTVIFVRKGLKQWILATKKNLGWDTYVLLYYP